MILCPLTARFVDSAKMKPKKNGITYLIKEQTNENLNVFFVKDECIVRYLNYVKINHWINLLPKKTLCREFYLVTTFVNNAGITVNEKRQSHI